MTVLFWDDGNSVYFTTDPDRIVHYSLNDIIGELCCNALCDEVRGASSHIYIIDPDGIRYPSSTGWWNASKTWPLEQWPADEYTYPRPNKTLNKQGMWTIGYMHKQRMQDGSWEICYEKYDLRFFVVGPCEDYQTQLECEEGGCYWYDGSCHSEQQQPEICDWIDAQGGPSGLTITDVFTIIDSYLYNTPPSEYTFIPTVQNVFGVIDYYLGFDGDAKTGCDFFP